MGLSGFLSPATSAIVGLMSTRVDDRRALILGTWASIAGAAAIVMGTNAESLTVMLVGQAICGGGFGAAFTAALRLIIPRAAIHQRAAVAAAIYLISYSTFGIPVILAGQVAGSVGLVATVAWYSALAVLLAVAGLAAQIRLRSR
jgi:MFS family permease